MLSHCKKEDDRMRKYQYVDVDKFRLVKKNVIFYLAFHLLFFYSVFIGFTRRVYAKTIIFQYMLLILSNLGVTAGSHRLWTHRAYKAKISLRIFLATLFAISGQNDIFSWVRDHRIHHLHSETDADPHNSKRGFFFAHMGWLLYKKHPDVAEKGEKLDLSDIRRDRVVMFQKRFNRELFLLLSILFPTLIPVHFWDESLAYSFTLSVGRFVLSLHCTWFVNSAAHMWGNRPYDVNIEPRENYFVSFGAIGEGFHNYHHAFPWDYATSEFGWKMNFTTFFIDTMAFVGLAYDRKHLSESMCENRKERVLRD